MKVLIVGGGGREHALAWKVAKSKKITEVFVAPGNAGTFLEDKITNVNIKVDDIKGLVDFAKKNQIGLTIIGPEVPLVLGIVDIFQENNLRCFGPSKKAAQLEGSKDFSKEFFVRHNIPTAKYRSFTDSKKAIDYLQTCSMPIVIKADGLAEGKGVVIAKDLTIAITTVQEILENNKFGKAGTKIIIEDFLQGEEASFIVMSDGDNILPMATSQDHKARDNGDKGPNTGGMGAYSPAPIIDKKTHQKIINTVIKPCIEGMKKDGNEFVGFLYAGLMIRKTENNEKNINVLEINVRFGDPETQPIMMRLKSDLVELCDYALDKKLDKIKAVWDEKTALAVVMTAGGYPFSYEKNNEITNIPKENKNYKTFYAGAQVKNKKVLTCGGRVLNICALDDSVLETKNLAYQNVEKISFKGCYYRTDIGDKAIHKDKS